MNPFLPATLNSDGAVPFMFVEQTPDAYIGPQAYYDGMPLATDDAVEAADVQQNGMRFKADGTLRAYDATDALPSGASVADGFAYTSDGQLCYTLEEPSAATVYIGGVAVREDGAVHAAPLPWAFPEVLDYYDARYGITVATGVSAWAPALNGSHTLTQAVADQQPAWTDGNSILFDGTNDVLKTASFTLEQPTTVVVCGRQMSWASDDRWFDGNANDTGTLVQAVATPQVRMSAGALVGAAGNSPALETYAIIGCVFNGASSLIQMNLNTSATGDAGAADMNGLTVGRYGASGVGYGNVQIKAIAVCDSALSAARLTALINAMNAQYGVF